MTSTSTELNTTKRRLAETLLTKAFGPGTPLRIARVFTRQPAFVAALALPTEPGSVVVKLDRDPVLVGEALRLRYTADDTRLPEHLRQAVPRMHAVASDGDLHGCLMEYLTTHHPMGIYLASPERLHEAPAIMRALWNMLEKAYESSASRRLQPNTQYWWVNRVLPNLERAGVDEPLLAADRTIRLTTGSTEVQLPPWPTIVAAAREVAHPAPFATWVHGDLNLGNILVRPGHAGPELRLIDLRDWFSGDPVGDFEVAAHIRALAVVQSNGLAAPVTLVARGSDTVMTFELPSPPAPLVEAEKEFLVRAAGFATTHGDANWETRYRLKVGSTLVATAGSHLAGVDARGRDLARAVFVEGLRWMWAATRLGRHLIPSHDPD